MLIAVNLAVWLLILATGAAASVWVDRLSLRPAGLCRGPHGGYFDVSQSLCASQGGTWLPGVSDGATWQLVTSMFTHVAVLHIGFNMLALWILGPQLELLLGRVRYLGLYLLSGLVGSASVYWLSPESTPTLGASGAIFGLMGALLVFALKVRGDVNQLLIWIGINVAFTFFGSWHLLAGAPRRLLRRRRAGADPGLRAAGTAGGLAGRRLRRSSWCSSWSP